MPPAPCPARLGSSSASAHERAGPRQSDRPPLGRPPPFRPGTDSDNHPFCNKQETSLPASKIEQTKTPKYEAPTVGSSGFFTRLPDGLQGMAGGVFVFSKFHPRKRLAMCLHRCSAPGAQGREAVWPAKLRALPRPRLLSLQPSCKWSNHKGHGSLDLCLASTLNRSPTPQCCPSCGSPPQAAPFTPTASSATQNPPAPGSSSSKNHAADISCTDPLIKTRSWAHAVPSAENTVPCLAHSLSEAFTLE